MSFLASITVKAGIDAAKRVLKEIREFIAEIRQEKKIAELEGDKKELQQKYDELLEGFNKYLRGELTKSRGKKKPI